ncbi:hypothetical protein CC1G_02320 [Coprinopsis cinerea okayama7|uniref:F-box domain-containing protein n=1 Tax=Coprinopsis cinerea (strain Okayama-7 / 130 / ATCC MYA-4618 / FGSC 9003) TaxID=240176 RepID=A8N7R3_COPC7|nr:hypothetical protein CC1G_02320 [Coprinopsis cinerea okayama7\|eukprot:XP_001830869.1 hypothetical protein CC1G_02320 [Coprinopsis cinerea okayama7\
MASSAGGLASRSPSLEARGLRLPPEVIYRLIDQYLGLDEWKTLSRSCRALHRRCRKYIFQEVELSRPIPMYANGIQVPPPIDEEEGSAPPTTLVERFEALLRRSPDITNLIRKFNIHSLPMSTGAFWENLWLSREERAWRFVLTQEYSALHELVIEAKWQVVFSRIRPEIQTALFKFVQSPRLCVVSFAMRSFPVSLIENCWNASRFSLCGQVVPHDPKIPLPPVSKNNVNRRARPWQVSMCHVPDESVSLITKSSKIDIGELGMLNFNGIDGYSFAVSGLVRESSPSLCSLILTVKNPAVSVPLPLGRLLKLQTLIVTIEAHAIVSTLNWLDLSAATIPYDEHQGLWGEITLALCAGMENPEEARLIHVGLWKEVQKLESVFPNLRKVNIRGTTRGHEVDGTIKLLSLGLYHADRKDPLEDWNCQNCGLDNE